MLKPTVRSLFFLLCIGVLALAACSSVAEFASGYVTFPKEAVRAVFESMEADLSLPGEPLRGLGPNQSPAAGGASSSLGSGPSPSCPQVPFWWPVGVACAQEARVPMVPTLPEDPHQALLDELKGMVEVREALLSRRQRKDLVEDWKRGGIVGEARDGNLVFLTDRGQVDREILARVANENDDRSILIRAVSKAVVIINDVEPSERNISEQIDATRREFAAARRRISPGGTWVQLPDGQWVKK